MLRERRDICRYVRKLAVRPNYYLAWPKPDEELSEVWVVDMIEEFSKDLVMMHTFDWDGLEQPKDSLWTTLRLKCVRNSYGFSLNQAHMSTAALNSKACFQTSERNPLIPIVPCSTSLILQAFRLLCVMALVVPVRPK